MLIVKAVGEDGKTVHGFQAKIKYLPGRYSDGEYIREGKLAGDIAFKRFRPTAAGVPRNSCPTRSSPSTLRPTATSQNRKSSNCPKGRSKTCR